MEVPLLSIAMISRMKSLAPPQKPAKPQKPEEKPNYELEPSTLPPPLSEVNKSSSISSMTKRGSVAIASGLKSFVNKAKRPR